MEIDCPVKEGEEHTVKIESIGEKKDGTPGDGVTKIEKFVIFVANSEVDKEYKVRITRVLSRYGFAEIID